MVKRARRSTRVKPGFKKCLISKLRGAKIKTAKQARKAFSVATKKCRKVAAKKMKKCKYGHRKGSSMCLKRPRTGKRKAKGAKRHCKYGHRKGTKRCRKTPKRR
ncbi:MAG TPA: hypothetical protein PLW50_00655 [Smithellaceae bacterium]|nr:hypothetical protein [Smithellaceae bacterium]